MLKVYKQKTNDGCLPICLMIMGDINANKQKELEIIYSSLKKYRDNYYALNTLTAFCEIYNLHSDLYVDNLWFSKYLKRHSKNKNIRVLHHEINQDFFESVKLPFALYVDDFVLGEESHSQHFIVVEQIKNQFATIIDPWRGVRRNVNKEILTNGVEGLKKQFLYCPLLITLNKI